MDKAQIRTGEEPRSIPRTFVPKWVTNTARVETEQSKAMKAKPCSASAGAIDSSNQNQTETNPPWVAPLQIRVGFQRQRALRPLQPSDCEGELGEGIRGVGIRRSLGLCRLSSHA